MVAVLVLTPLLADVFSQGQKHVGITFGAGTGYGDDYTIFGINANYFVIDNLAVGLEYHGWFGGSPMVHEVSVPLTYYAPIHPKYNPYLGGFYRKTFIESEDDRDSYGFRGGLSVRMGETSYSSIGWVQEYYEDRYGESHSSGYPEVTVGVSF
jgi:hypothetical protein